MKNKGKQPRSRRTIETVLDAAAHVLIEHGYSKASTNRIAEKSGYSVGTLYQYFDDKEDVYRELVVHESEKIVTAVEQATVCASLRDTLESMMVQVLRVLGNNPLLVQAVGQLMAGPFQDIRTQARVHTVAGVTHLLEAHRNEIVVQDLQLAAATIVSATEGFAVNARSTDFPVETLLEHGVRLQLAYLTMRFQA